MKIEDILLQGYLTPEVMNCIKDSAKKDITPEMWGEYMTKGLPISVYIDWLKEQMNDQKSAEIGKYLKNKEVVLFDKTSNVEYHNDEVKKIIEELCEKLSNISDNLQLINEYICRLQHLVEIM